MSSPTPPSSLRSYLPLAVILMMAFLATVAKVFDNGPHPALTSAMHDFMGFFLVIFAMMKLFDLGGFANGFQKYDILAQRSRSYALAYPFLELALGLSYLSGIAPQPTYIATIVLMGFGAVGVIRALRKGLDIQCACLGTSLRVPLSTVALFEDLGMAMMALAMLLLHS